MVGKKSRRERNRWVITVIVATVSMAVGIVGGGLTFFKISKDIGFDAGSIYSDVNVLKRDVQDLKSNTKNISSIETNIDQLNKNTENLIICNQQLQRDLAVLQERLVGMAVDISENRQKIEDGKFQKDPRVENIIGTLRAYGLWGEGGAHSDIELKTKPPKTFKGRIGIIKQPGGALTASGWPYNAGDLVAAKNLNGKIKNAKFGDEYHVMNLSYKGTPTTTVAIVDTFYTTPDILMAISTKAAEKIGFPFEKGIIKAEVTEKKSGW